MFLKFVSACSKNINVREYSRSISLTTKPGKQTAIYTDGFFVAAHVSRPNGNTFLDAQKIIVPIEGNPMAESDYPNVHAVIPVQIDDLNPTHDERFIEDCAKIKSLLNTVKIKRGKTFIDPKTLEVVHDRNPSNGMINAAVLMDYMKLATHGSIYNGTVGDDGTMHFFTFFGRNGQYVNLFILAYVEEVRK